MRIPINENTDDGSIYAPVDGQEHAPASPDWLDDVHIEQQTSTMSEDEAFFTDADPFDAPEPSQAIPFQAEEPQEKPDLEDDDFPDLDDEGIESPQMPEQPAASPEMSQQPSEDAVDGQNPGEATQQHQVQDDAAATTSQAEAEGSPRASEATFPAADREEPSTVSKEEYDTLQHRYDRLLADWENYKRRSARELLEAKENANQNLLKAMMPAFDDFARVAFHSQTSDNPEVAEVVAGVEAIHRKLFNALAREGVIEIAPEPGEPFDMNRHQAIERCPADEEHPVDCVMRLYQVGYEMNGKILRPAMVAVTV